MGSILYLIFFRDEVESFFNLESLISSSKQR